MTDATRLVWDLPLRIFHWVLVASFLASWITARIGTDAREIHMLLGYWMLGLIAFRLAWGVAGTRHSRFASFVPTPRALHTYVRDTLRGEARETVGHNPVGSLMVLAMLGLLGLQAVSGLFIDDDVMHEGPYRRSVSRGVAEAFSGIHHTVVDIIVALVAVHVAAVAYYALYRRHRIVRAMWTGHKPASVVARGEAITGSRVGLAVALVLVIAAIVYVFVAIVPSA